MKINSNFSSLLFFLVLYLPQIFAQAPESLTESLIESQIIVKVLLKEEDINTAFNWKIVSKNSNFSVSAPGTKARQIESQSLNISFKNNFFYINNKKLLKDYVIIKPVVEENCKSMLELDGTIYEGHFALVKSGNKAYLINFIDLESYVSSVLYGESWPGWSVEINEVFAIMCRTYVVAKLIENRKSKKKKDYDVKATNYHQTYKGYHAYQNLLEAVSRTKSIVLTHNGKPIVAMYDSCCGGIVPSKTKGHVNFSHAPYLARNYACTYCKESKIFNWKSYYSCSDILQIINFEHNKNLKKIVDISIKKDNSGIVKELKIAASNGHVTLTGKKVYNLFTSIRSLCFSVEKQANKIVFTGKGYGHLMGLCQWGAYEMIKSGLGYKQVLKFYYPGVSFMTVKSKLK